MQTRKMILTGFFSSLFTAMLILVVFFGVGTIQANNTAQEGDPQPPEAEGFQLPETPEEMEATYDAHYSGFEFIPYDADNKYTDTNGCVSISSGQWLVTPVHLPDGSTITAMRFYYVNNTAGVGILSFWRVDDGNGKVELARLHTHNLNISWSYDNHTGLDIPIDNTNYSYVFYWEPLNNTADRRLCGVRISYDSGTVFGAAFPLIEK
jgi:hypothetical protein